MQTITLSYVTSADDARTIGTWQRLHGCVVRTGYAHAHDADGAALSEKDLRNLLKARFPDHPLGSWGVHCATREAMRLRRQRPDGRMVFGGRANLERRIKGLIPQDEWHRRRQSRSIEIVGDRTRWGNRHLSIAPDGLSATIEFLRHKLVLRLPGMSGKTGRIVRALAVLMQACEIGVSFSLGSKSLSLTFDPWTCAGCRKDSRLSRSSVKNARLPAASRAGDRARTRPPTMPSTG